MKKNICIFIMLLIIVSVYSYELKVKTSNGKTVIILFDDTSNVLIFDHIASPLKEIVYSDDLTKIEKVVFSFVNLTEVEEQFWEYFSSVSTMEFVYSTVNNLCLLKYLPKLRVMSFSESNRLNDFSDIDLRYNESLEYIEFNNLVFKNFDGFKNVPESLKYLVIANSKLEESDYEKIRISIADSVILVIDYLQLFYSKNFNYLLNQNCIEELWMKYDING